jgi:thioredoxin 1
VQTFSERDWEQEVLRSPLPVAVAFSAEWCVPCTIMTPALEWASAHFRGRLKVGRIDVDANPAVSARYHVVGLPTLLVVDGGKEAERRVGLMDSSAIVKLLARHLFSEQGGASGAPP